jgi:dipeptidyl aminopeptidase/acylaminoacyl peptidase
MEYTEQEITFANGDMTLAGTLTLPEAPTAHPAVILLQGSGPLNRDEEAFGLKPFATIADVFARNGIAVLRYDSRGVGGSTGVAFQYTLSDVADDALAAVRCLKARSDLDARPFLESVKCPALLIFGELDRQVPAEMNREAMVGALQRGGNNDYLLRTFPAANHLFQSATTGSPSEYGTLGEGLVPGFLELMSDWILEKVPKP